MNPKPNSLLSSLEEIKDATDDSSLIKELQTRLNTAPGLNLYEEIKIIDFDADKSSLNPNRDKQSFVIEELTLLRRQVKEINEKIATNLNLLKEKQERSLQLKGVIEKIEMKTNITDTSFEERSTWGCNKSCTFF